MIRDREEDIQKIIEKLKYQINQLKNLHQKQIKQMKLLVQLISVNRLLKKIQLKPIQNQIKPKIHRSQQIRNGQFQQFLAIILVGVLVTILVVKSN
ncbi:unnamed protein product [Paramecium sonneborni]|uniref:Transmembrane protein n=1 Tax=Paramecium sonneborni TaxID=65129 RepID=A0A8S1MDL5_9CILI|nr:unnamed protein product [Paramecium sonneborni]